MCTALTLGASSAIFGRTLDVECSYGECALILPRGSFIGEGISGGEHPEITGVGVIADGTPLLFDAMSEHGIAAAALNFPMSAHYRPPQSGKRNIPSYALIPTVLAECRTLSDAAMLLRTVNITADSFSDVYPATPMHWMISDGRDALVAEPHPEGLSIISAAVGVLTNEPPYGEQMMRLAERMSLSPAPPENRILPDGDLPLYSGGLGAFGLPGDPSSTSRFLRAAYARRYTVSDGTEWGEVSRFFHIMEGVSVADGCSISPNGQRTRTAYTSCYDLTHRVLYLSTYSSHRIFSLAQDRIDLSGNEPLALALPKGGYADTLT